MPHGQSLGLRNALRNAGVDVALVALEGSGHGDGAFRNADALAKVREFFVHKLKPQLTRAAAP